jgi:hypothetical protein
VWHSGVTASLVQALQKRDPKKNLTLKRKVRAGQLRVFREDLKFYGNEAETPL